MIAQKKRKQNDAITESFTDVERLIYDQVHRFIRQNGGRFDDQLSEAFEAFVVAWHEYDQSRGPFPKCVRWYVWKTMHERNRNRCRRANILNRVTDDPDEHSVMSKPLIDLVDELSVDAKSVIELLFDHGNDVLHDVKKPTPRRTRIALKKFLVNLGWTDNRVTEAFTEIERAIQ